VIHPLSDLRDKAYLVLLGEPGAGKSTALRYEAAAEHGDVVTCREVMTGTPLSDSGTVYLDALDEYRSGDSSKDKLLRLANAISASNIRRWRLTCRAEDWRDAADINAMRRAANNEPIIVAHLLPLNEEEAQSVLAALGDIDPEKFVREAQNRGASAFIENPLSLSLLHSVVVSNGAWPTSRFELFQKATLALAHEHDPDRATDLRPSADKVIGAASALCFYLLASGAKALWRANSLPPSAKESDYVSIHSLGLEAWLVAPALDTALFRGKGHAFEPFHRTVAEFLGARFLAKRVVGTATTAALPLRRATALITGDDHKAPSEFRGLYAWFAAHLQQEGDTGGARQLIQADAATVLAYGDAAAFDTAGRKEILSHLDDDDPYFLTSQNEATVLGGLAGDDLVDDFIAILDAPVRSHLQVTILEALADAPPVGKIADKLREIVLGDSRPTWMRERAASVLIRKPTDPDTARRLLTDLASMVADKDQLAIRARILGSLPTEDIEPEQLRLLLSALDSLPDRAGNDEDTTEIGTLVPLSVALRRSPRVDLLDKGVGINAGRRRHKPEVQSLLDQLVASAINANQDVSAKTLYSWLANVRQDPWDTLDRDVVDALQGWIDRDPSHREFALFLIFLDNMPQDQNPWIVNNIYITTVRRIPSDAVLHGLLSLANTKDWRGRRRLLKVAAYVARSETHWPKWRKTIISRLDQEGRFRGFIKSLLSDPNARWKRQEARRQAKQEWENENSRKDNIAALTPKLEAIAKGGSSEFGALSWAAGLYRNTMIGKGWPPLKCIIKFANEEIAAAIAEGFVQFAIHADINVGVDELGKAAAKNAAYQQEYVVAAGLHQALLHDREADLFVCPLIVALVGLRQSYFSRDQAPSISKWAVGHLARDLHCGVDLILRYWNAALDAGDEDLDVIHHLTTAGEPKLLSRCLVALLEQRPNLPMQALRQALSACAAALSATDLACLIRRAVSRGDLDKRQREMWNFAGIALMPRDFIPRLSKCDQEAALLAPNGGLATAFDALCPEPDLLDGLKIATLGKSHPLKDDDWKHSGGVSGIVRAAIQRLSASTSMDAGERLKALGSKVHESWQPLIAHAAADHARKVRDENFTAPLVRQLMKALADGPPASPLDLAAVVLEEVDRYKNTLRTGTEMPWKRFWNTDEYGRATEPQIENEDRDRLLELFRPRLERYGIAANLPEARRGENTRVDILLLSHAGKNLPIEAKRHYNDELWTAPANQLALYASDENACGFGVYLVFWFGAEFKAPARDDGIEVPDTAEALETTLIESLPTQLMQKLTVVVLDVSRPQSMVRAMKERGKKSTTLNSRKAIRDHE
jgi:hypothetical protein